MPSSQVHSIYSDLSSELDVVSHNILLQTEFAHDLSDG